MNPTRLIRALYCIIGLFGFLSNHAQAKFPDDWLGIYSGKLEIFSNQGKVQTVPMSITQKSILRDSLYEWSITYGEDTIKGKRDYRLIIKDKSKGHYAIDELNGIILDAYVFDNKLISNFTVMNSQLTSIYTLQDDKMIFEILVNKSTPSSTTGGNEKDGEKIPEVLSYSMTTYQRAELKKVKDY
jgi:hypothetical protein